MSETAHLLRLERSRGLARSAASSDSAKNWTATVPLGLGSFGLGRGEPRFAVSTVSTSPCGDAACLRSSEITGHRCAGWPRGGLRAVVDLLLLGRLLAAPATATAVPAVPVLSNGGSWCHLPCLAWLCPCYVAHPRRAEARLIHDERAKPAKAAQPFSPGQLGGAGSGWGSLERATQLALLPSDAD